MSRTRRVNRQPLRLVVEARVRGGSWSIMSSGCKNHWWELSLACGHTVERSMRYEPGGERGWGRMWHGRPLDEALPAPKRVRCEECPGVS